MNPLTHHPCKQCGQSHPLFYLLMADSTQQLFYRCDKNYQQYFVTYREGLPISEIKSERVVKQEKPKQQLELI